MNQLLRTHLGRIRPACIFATVVLLTTGCGVGGKEFRDAALPDIETGIRAVLDGLVNGVFAVRVELELARDDQPVLVVLLNDVRVESMSRSKVGNIELLAVELESMPDDIE